jgi:hypothetical protein
MDFVFTDPLSAFEGLIPSQRFGSEMDGWLLDKMTRARVKI